MVGGAPVARSQRDGVWAFSEECKHAAVARPDGSVDVFDMTAGARVVERFAGSPSSSGRPSALAISHKRTRSSFAVATGTPGGDVSIAGNVATVLSGGCVAALVFSAAGLFACGGADKNVTLIDLETGKVLQRCSIGREHRNALSSLAVSATGTMTAACSQNISLLDIATGKTIRSFSGHASPITTSSFFANDTRLVTGSTDDQFLYIWDTTVDDIALQGKSPSSGKKQKRRRKSSRLHPVHTLIAPEQGIRSIAVMDNQEGGYSFAAVLKSGVVAVWPHWKIDCKDASTKASSTIYPCAKDSAHGVPAVHGVGFCTRDTLSVLYGSTLKPQVHSLALVKMANVMYLPKPCSDNLLISQNAPLCAGQVPGLGNSAVDVTRAEVEAPEAITATATGKSNLPNGSAPRRKREKRKSRGDDDTDGDEEKEACSDDEEDSEASSGSGTDDESGEEEEESAEPTLHERLEAIGVSNGEPAPIASGADGKVQLKEKLDSRAEVILQALKSKDERLLSSVITQRNPPAVVQATIRQLPVDVASGSFLEFLVLKLRREPRHVINVIPWLQNILYEHAGALISQPKSTALCNLMDTVTKRNQALDALNRLEGRLELVVAQANRASSLMKTKLHNAKPQVEYVERVKKGDEDDMNVSEEDEESEDEESEEDDEEEETREYISGEESSDESDDGDVMDVVGADGNGHESKQKPKMNGHVQSAKDTDGDSSSD